MGYWKDYGDIVIQQITDHVARALNRLFFQYKESTDLQSFITATNGEQAQDIEDAGFGLFGRLDIDGSSSVQLDGIGEIVGQERFGLADAEYRLILKARIAKNVSEGDVERLISTWKLLTGANKLEFHENPTLETIALALMQGVAAGGVSVGFAVVFDPDNAFGFADSGVNTGGFGDTGDAGAGGEFSSLIGV